MHGSAYFLAVWLREYDSSRTFRKVINGQSKDDALEILLKHLVLFNIFWETFSSVKSHAEWLHDQADGERPRLNNTSYTKLNLSLDKMQYVYSTLLWTLPCHWPFDRFSRCSSTLAVVILVEMIDWWSNPLSTYNYLDQI